VNVAAHSMYVSTLDFLGVIGLGALLAAYWFAFVASRRRLRSDRPLVSQLALLFVAWTAMQATFFVGYSTGAFAGMLLGLTWAFVRTPTESLGVVGTPEGAAHGWGSVTIGG